MKLQIPKDKRRKYLNALIPKLNLEFPQAEISEKTGYDEGNISAFLSGSKNVSGPFFTKFLQEFPIEPPADWDKEDDPAIQSDIQIRLSDYLKEIEARRKEIEKSREREQDINDKLFDLLRTNLAKNTQYLETIVASGSARSQEIMNYFDKKEGNAEGTMFAKAGIKEHDLLQNLRNMDSQDGAGK